MVKKRSRVSSLATRSRVMEAVGFDTASTAFASGLLLPIKVSFFISNYCFYQISSVLQLPKPSQLVLLMTLGIIGGNFM